jgi:hypothetical protein
MASDKMTKEATSDRRSRRNLYLDVELIRHRAPLASLRGRRARCGLGAVLQSLRAAGFEDEDDDENASDEPYEAGVVDIGRARTIR